MEKDEKISIEEYNKLKNELEEFMYAFSHDFSAPLRHIREFSNLLIMKADDRLEEEEREYAQILTKSVISAEQMVQGLLKLSRLNTRAEEFEDIELNDLLSQVTNDFSENNAKINFSDLPKIRGERQQIKELFTQLIDNAIKFKKEDCEPEIQIFCSDNPKILKFSVTDNGIGMALEFAKDCFTVFRKYHTNESIAGVGIGLTLCKNIVEKHKGKIWIESSSSQGTTVSFTLQTS